MQAEAILIKQEGGWALIRQDSETEISGMYGDFATLADKAFDMLDRKDIFRLEVHQEDGSIKTYPA